MQPVRIKDVERMCSGMERAQQFRDQQLFGGRIKRETSMFHDFYTFFFGFIFTHSSLHALYCLHSSRWSLLLFMTNS